MRAAARAAKTRVLVDGYWGVGHVCANDQRVVSACGEPTDGLNGLVYRGVCRREVSGGLWEFAGAHTGGQRGAEAVVEDSGHAFAQHSGGGGRGRGSRGGGVEEGREEEGATWPRGE